MDAPQAGPSGLDRALNIAIILAVAVFTVLIAYPRIKTYKPVVKGHGKLKNLTTLPAQKDELLPDYFAQDQYGRDRPVSTADGYTLIYVYSPSCAHCMGELPKLVASSADWQNEGWRIFGLQFMGNAATLAQSEAQGLPGFVLADGDGSVCAKLGLGEFTVILTGPGRRVFYRGSVDGLKGAAGSLLARP
jgi:hypothetical protein